jgi:hypothetical protein
MLQFFGFVFFITMVLAGFWCLTMLANIAIVWAIFGPMENYGSLNKDVDPETVRRKKLYEQEDIEVLYQKA